MQKAVLNACREIDRVLRDKQVLYQLEIHKGALLVSPRLGKAVKKRCPQDIKEPR
jgi:hypothetical protein